MEASSLLAKDNGSAASMQLLLRRKAEEHSCASHPLFEFLENNELSNRQVASLLRNYDAHASVLRRLLLNAATLMPEEAVPYVLENVRNEYGNGDYSRNHQGQLRDLAFSCGVSSDDFHNAEIQVGVKEFIKEATRFYSPKRELPDGMKVAAVVSGAITATELLAIKEFVCMQKAFSRRGMQHHIWFHHCSIELEHSDESVALAMYFVEKQNELASVEYGLNGVLDANIHLYDGLLSSIA